jgi:hypothetical protein
MEALIVKEDEGIPRIVLDKDKDVFEISGNSLPEDMIGLYSPVFKWIDEYKKQPNPETKLVVKLNYFNSSSSKAILDIIISLSDLIYQGFKVKVVWHYLDMDDDNLSTGKEFEGVTKIPFQYIPYQDDGSNNRFIVE